MSELKPLAADRVRRVCAGDAGGRNRMYKLMVSYNCGITYCPETWAENPGELDARCDELDIQGLRWTIEDERGKPVYRACVIHAEIIAFMERVNVHLALKANDAEDRKGP